MRDQQRLNSACAGMTTAPLMRGEMTLFAISYSDTKLLSVKSERKYG